MSRAQMVMPRAAAGADTDRIDAIAARLRRYLQSGVAPPHLFSDDVFCDFTFPLGRVQAQGLADTLALRRHGHPASGSVPRWRVDATAHGFVMEFEERWEQGGQQWYCREMLRADLRGDAICALSVYCTGDWDQQRQASHRAGKTLLRP
jgi:hypothetical protein